MTIVQINVADYGSTGVIMQTVQKLASCKGYTAHSFAGRCKHLGEGCEPIGSTADTYFHAILSRLGKNGHGSKAPTVALVKKLNEIKPDAIILHNIHGYYIHLETLFTALAEELSNTHIFWVLHDCWAFTGGCAHFYSVGCEKWQTENLSCPENSEKQENCGDCKIHAKLYPKSYIDTTAEEFLFKKSLFTALPKERVTVVAPSEWIASMAKKSFLNKYDIKVIPNGINIETFQPRSPEEKLGVLVKYGIPYDKPIVLGVASVWDERKQPKLFHRLANIAKDCTILMVGLSEKQLKQLPANVYGILRTENTFELSCVYSAAAVLLNPSLEDTFPLVPLEALACGTPVITSPVCGCPEQVNHLTGIILSNPSSVNEAYRAVSAVLDEQKKSASVSIKEAENITYTTELCRGRAVDLYDNYKMAAAYINLIEKTIN